MSPVSHYLLIVGFVCLFVLEQYVLAQQSGVYAENELQQTVFVGGLSPKKRQHLSDEMLQV